MTTDPLWINQSGGLPEYNAAEMRGAMGAVLFGGVADRLGSRQGVRPGLAVASLAGTTWTVHSHPAVVYPGLTSTAAAYWVVVPADTGSTSPADGTNPRKDLLVVRVYDDDEDSLGRRDCDVEYVVGVPAVSPVEPAVPAGAMKLATITVPASGAGDPTIVVNAPYTVANGGLLPVRDTTERPTDGLYNGLAVWRQDTKTLEVWDGTTWAPIYAGDTGWVQVAASASFPHVAGNPLQVRKQGNRVKIQGSVTRNFAMSPSGTGVRLTTTALDVAFRLDRSSRFEITCLNSGSFGAKMAASVLADGHIDVYNVGTADLAAGARLDFNAGWWLP